MPPENDWDCAVFRCDCGSPEHMVTVDIYTWSDGNVEFFLQVSADPIYLPWYKRMWTAIKYVFNNTSLKWHSVSLKHNDVIRLKQLIEKYETYKRVYNK